VWQDGSNSSSWDGLEANRQADALGFPTFVPIYYAEESLTPLDVLARRLDGLPDTRPKRLYDGAPRIQAMIDEGHVTGGWITGALSASQLPGEHPHPTLEEAIARAPGAQLVQLVGSDVPGTDLNRILKPDWGGWHPDQPFEEEDMPLNDADKKFIRDQVLDIVRQEGISANAASSATGVLTVLNAIGNLDLHLDVDEGALAKALAPALTARLGALSMQDLNDVATAVNDEQSRRGGR
jgi:hypothetical protein